MRFCAFVYLIYDSRPKTHLAPNKYICAIKQEQQVSSTSQNDIPMKSSSIRCLDDFIHHTTKQKKLQEFQRSFFIMVYFLSIYHNFSQIL